MPSSPNRRRLEIPNTLYTRLEGESRHRQMTAAGLAAALLVGALDRGESKGERSGETQDALRQLLEHSTRQTAELRALRRELTQATPQLQSSGLARVAPPANLARAFDSADWAELRMAERGPGARITAFQGALEGSSLPPALREYVRLLWISDLTQSESLRAEYRRQAEALRAHLATIPTDELLGITSGERSGDVE